MSSSNQPLIRGALRQTPLAEFLLQAYDGQLEGTLLLQTPEREKSAILFVRGAPAKARPARDNVYLGKVAVDLGLVEASVATSARKRAEAEGKTHGAILREDGHLDETALYVALRQQLFRQVLLLCELPDTTGFGFYPANYLAEYGDSGEWRVKPLPMLWRAVTDHLPEKRRAAWLERLGDTTLKIRPEAPVSRYALTDQEKAIVDMLRAMPSTVEKLSESGVGTPELVRRVTCGLLLSRQLDVGSAQEPIGLNEPPESPNSVPPPQTRVARRGITMPRPPNLPAGMGGGADHGPVSARARKTSTMSKRPMLASAEKLKAEIKAWQDGDPKNHYEVLGVANDADTSIIRSAFFQLARTWHPDRLPKELSEYKSIVNKAFAAMGEAHQTLSDDTKRRAYDEALDGTPDDEQAQVAAILEASSAYQRAEAMMKTKDFKGALEQAKLAYEGDPTQADYAAIYGWLQGMGRTKGFDDLIELLDSALKDDENNVNALWYRGQLLKKAGHHLRAIKDFKKIVGIKPRHMEAQRELRVHAMRKRSNKEATNTSGLFGRFKKKD